MQIIDKRSAIGHGQSPVETGGLSGKFRAFGPGALLAMLFLLSFCSCAGAVEYYAGATYTFSTPSYPDYLYLWSAVDEQGHAVGTAPDYSRDTFVWTAPQEPQKVIISVIVASNWLVSCKDYAELPIEILPRGSITVVKSAIPRDPQEFQFTGSPDIGQFVLYDDGTASPDPTPSSRSFVGLLPGTYSLEETVPEGWILTGAVCSDGSPVDRIELASGESITATFTNTKLGQIEITKAVNWNGVEPDPDQTFKICLQGPSYPLGTEDGACKTAGSDGGKLTWTGLKPGRYTVTEADPGSQWTVVTLPEAIDLSAGQSAAATVTNDHKLSGLIVTKTVDWNGGTPNPDQTFEICIKGPSYPDGDCKSIGSSGGDLAWQDLIPGEYTVSETDPGAAWTVEVAGSPVTVAVGASGRATVSNVQKRGSLTVTKTVDWNGGTPNPDQTFEICIKGPSYPDGDCKSIGSSGGDLAWQDLIPGEYTVSETPLVGWTTTVSGSPAAVVSGQTASAQVNNKKYPFGGKFEISGQKFNDLNGNGVKDAGEPGIGGWTIFIKLEGGDYSQSVTTSEDGSYLFTDLPQAGTYVVWENPSENPGWIPTAPPGGTASVVLTGDAPAAKVDFGNMQPKLVVTKVADHTSVYAGTTITFTLTVTNDADVAVDNVELVDTLSPGLIYQGAVPEPSSISGNKITWNLGTLAAHESREVILRAQVDPALCPTQPVITEGTETSPADLLTVQSAAREPSNLPLIMEALARNKTKLEAKMDSIRRQRDAFNRSRAILGTSTKTILGVNYSFYNYTNASTGEILSDQINATGFLVAVEFLRPEKGDLLRTAYGPMGENLSDFYEFRPTRESLLIEYNHPGSGYRTYTVRYYATGDTLIVVVDPFGNVISRTYEKRPGLVEVTGPLTNCAKAFGTVGITSVQSNEACVQITWSCQQPQPEDPYIEVVKVAEPTVIPDDYAGTIKYTYTVKNIGVPEIIFLTLVDDKLGVIVQDELVNLAQGDSVSFVVYYQVKPSDLKHPSIVNVVTATGLDENGLIAEDTDDAVVKIVSQYCVWLNKTASPKIVKPGEYITYTINYGVEADAVCTDIKDIKIVDTYPKGVYFISANPAPSSGNNYWYFPGPLGPGESGKIVILVQVAQSIGNTTFDMGQGVTGKGFVNVHNDICTEPLLLTNRVTMEYKENGQNEKKYLSASTDVNVGLPQTCVNLREYGSGDYASEDVIKYRNYNRSIEWNKSLKVSHRPTTFSLPGNRSISYPTKWIEKARSKNYATGGSTNEEYTYASNIDRQAYIKLDENGSTLITDTSFEGVGHIGLQKKDADINTTWNATDIFESQEDYVGKFQVYQMFDEYGSNAEYKKSVEGEGYVAGDRRVGDSQRSYESGTGSYKSDERISTVVNYIAKDVDLRAGPTNYSYTPTFSTSSGLLWQEGMWSKTPSSLISERFSSAQSLQKNTTAPGLNEMRTEAKVTGRAQFRTVYKNPDEKNSSDQIDIDDEFIGQYAIKRMTRLTGVAKYSRPHITLTKVGRVDLANTTFADYRIVVENDGNHVLGPVYVKDIFPVGTQYIYSSLRPTELTSSFANWTLLSLGIGSKVTLDLRLNITEEPSNLVNRVQAAGKYSSGWTVASNFSAIQIHWLTCCPPQLSTSKSAQIDAHDPRVIWYRLDLQNREDYTMVAFLMDQLPEGMVFLNSTLEPSQNDTNFITWTILNLGPREQRSIIYRARVAGDGTYVNRAHIDAYSVDGPDAASADVTARVDIGQGGAVYPSHSSDWYPPACFGLNCSGQIISDDWAPCYTCGAKEPAPAEYEPSCAGCVPGDDIP